MTGAWRVCGDRLSPELGGGLQLHAQRRNSRELPRTPRVSQSWAEWRKTHTLGVRNVCSRGENSSLHPALGALVPLSTCARANTPGAPDTAGSVQIRHIEINY